MSLFEEYPGFSSDFKRITKKCSTYEWFEANVENVANVANVANSDNNEESVVHTNDDSDACSSDDDSSENDDNECSDDDGFDNTEPVKSVSVKNIQRLKKKHLFYFKMDNTDKKGTNQYSVIFFDRQLRKDVERTFETSIGKYNKMYSICLSDLYSGLNDLEEYHATSRTKLLALYLKELFKPDVQRMQELFAKRQIDYKSLWYYFDHKRRIYCIKHLGYDVCFEHNSFEYESNVHDGNNLLLNGSVYLLRHNNDESQSVTQKVIFEFRIPEFSGKMDIEKLNIVSYDEPMCDIFEQRFDKIVNFQEHIVQKEIDGHQFLRKKDRMIKVKRQERVMVDGVNSYDYDLYPTNLVVHAHGGTEECTKKMLLYPFVPIFNLGIHKTWGITHIDDLTDVCYNEDAIHKLVLNEDRKDIIMSLIKADPRERAVHDFIKNKSDNTIFMLHGKPGVGKTLTAEAVSEHIHRPLYRISMGDLDMDDLENCLKDIDGLCNDWNAVLLIDEADIFLEERDLHNMSRNAVVSIFLQFLEYNRNIIFLTTNRLSTLDPAIQSRINMIIKYADLIDKNRVQIWKQTLDQWKVLCDDNDMIGKLSAHTLNGREILKICQTAMSVMTYKEMDITSDNFVSVVEKCMKINKEFKMVSTMVTTSLYS